MYAPTSTDELVAQRAAPGAAPSAAPATAATTTTPEPRTIGDIMRESHRLSAAQINQILVYQRERQVRFGDAAVALGIVSADEVLRALSEQFRYPYAPPGQLSDELVTATRPFSDEAEAIRGVRHEVTTRLAQQEGGRRAVAVVSPNVGDGKTYVAANLAIAFSQLRQRTLLVDADMRNPRLHTLFGLREGTGLSGILSGRTQRLDVLPVPGLPHLFVLPVGAVPPNPLELIESPAFDVLLLEMLQKFNHVIVDTPAAAYGADGSAIAAHCGAALAVARRRRSKLAAMERMVERMRANQTLVLGALLNQF